MKACHSCPRRLVGSDSCSNVRHRCGHAESGAISPNIHLNLGVHASQTGELLIGAAARNDEDHSRTAALHEQYGTVIVLRGGTAAADSSSATSGNDEKRKKIVVYTAALGQARTQCCGKPLSREDELVAQIVALPLSQAIIEVECANALALAASLLNAKLIKSATLFVSGSEPLRTAATMQQILPLPRALRQDRSGEGLLLTLDFATSTKPLPLEAVVSTQLVTGWGVVTQYGLTDLTNGQPVLAFVFGEIAGPNPIIVRLHSGCITGDVFHSEHCDCRHGLHRALESMAGEGRGILIYYPGHEARGLGPRAAVEKILAYSLQREGHDTFEANRRIGHADDYRDYSAAARLLKHLGVREVRLITANPLKRRAIADAGIAICDSIVIPGGMTTHNAAYLSTKVTRGGHDPRLLSA